MQGVKRIDAWQYSMCHLMWVLLLLLVVREQ